MNVIAEQTDDREVTVSAEDDAHTVETRLSMRQARRLLIDLAHAVDDAQPLDHEHVFDAADLVNDREGVQFKCPVCREKVEQNADDSPGYVPPIYLYAGGNQCYECGTEFEVQIGITEVEES